MSWSPGGSLMPCEGAAAIDFIFTSTHITVSLSWRLLFFFFFCPRLIRTLERYGASVGFQNEVKDTAVSKSYPHPSLPLCCLTYPGILYITWGLTETKAIVYWFFFYYYFMCRNDVISISISSVILSASVRVCVYMYLCPRVGVCLCAHHLFCVSVYSMCAHGCLRIHAFHVGIRIHTAVIEGYYCHLLSHERLSLIEIFIGRPGTNVQIRCSCIIKRNT